MHNTVNALRLQVYFIIKIEIKYNYGYRKDPLAHSELDCFILDTVEVLRYDDDFFEHCWYAKCMPFKRYTTHYHYQKT